MGDCAVRWRPDEVPTWQGFTDSAMALPDPSGGTLYVDREAPPFTPAEYARAHALVDLATMISVQLADRWQLLLPAGDEVTLRQASDDDLDELVAMYERCSTLTRELCGPRSLSEPVREQFAVLLAGGPALVAVADTGRIVALGSLVWVGPAVEVGLLVEDAWQRRGLGTALLRRAVRLAAAAGVSALHARVPADNAAMIHTLRRLGLPMRHESDGEIVTLRVDLGPDVTAGIGSPSPAR
jgi:GNAT superfamily N-acetyltransferase